MYSQISKNMTTTEKYTTTPCNTDRMEWMDRMEWKKPCRSSFIWLSWDSNFKFKTMQATGTHIQTHTHTSSIVWETSRKSVFSLISKAQHMQTHHLAKQNVSKVICEQLPPLIVTLLKWARNKSLCFYSPNKPTAPGLITCNTIRALHKLISSLL